MNTVIRSLRLASGKRTGVGLSVDTACLPVINRANRHTGNLVGWDENIACSALLGLLA